MTQYTALSLLLDLQLMCIHGMAVFTLGVFSTGNVSRVYTKYGTVYVRLFFGGFNRQLHPQKCRASSEFCSFYPIVSSNATF